MSDINITIRLASKAATDGMDRFGRAATGAEKKLTLFQKVARQASRSLDSFYGNLGANLAFRAFNVITTGLANTVTNIRAFETALVGVGKTTGLSGRALAVLGAEIENLSQEIPVASTELLDLGKTAAQLGVTGSDNILKFTETMARLAASTDIVGEQGAIAFARIINVTDESVDNIDRLGSSIVTLGNNFAATESQILAVSNEVAKGGARFGLTAEQVLGLSTAMAALGVEAQVAGSTTQKVFSLVEKAIGQGGDELKKFTDVLGLNRSEFINLFKTEPQKFFIELVKGLKASKDGGKELSISLAELGFQDLRVTKTLGPLIDRVDLLTRATDLSSEAFIANTALLEESEAAFATLDGDVQLLENSWIALTNSLLRAVLPAIKATIKALTSILEFVGETHILLDAFTATLIAASLALSTMAVKFAIATVAGWTFNGFMIAATLTAQVMWKAFLGPIGLAITGITALTAAFQIYRATTDDTKDTTDDIKDSTEGYNTVLQTTEQRTKNTREELEKLNKEFNTAIGLEDILNNKANQAGQGSVLDPSFVPDAGKEDAAAAAKKRADDLKAAQQRELDDLRTFGEQRAAIRLEQLRQEFIGEDGEITLQEELKLQKEMEKEAQELASRQEFLAQKLGLDSDFNKIKTDNEKKALTAELKTIKQGNDAKLKLENTLANQKANIQQAGFGLAAAVAKDGSKAQFLIQKAAAVASLALERGRALGAIPAQTAVLPAPAVPPAVVALTANANTSFAIGLATVLASTIKGFQDGGVVGGNSFAGDNVLARVNSGEMILNQEQQAELFSQANGQSTQGGGDTVIQIDGEEVFRVVSRQVANGGVLGEGGV